MKFLRPRRLLTVSEDHLNLVIEFYTLNYMCSNIFSGSKCPHGLNQTDGRKYSQGLACRYAHASKKQMYRTSMSDLVPPLYVLAAADRPLGLVRAFLTSYEVGLVLLCVVAACYCVRPAREDNSRYNVHHFSKVASLSRDNLSTP